MFGAHQVEDVLAGTPLAALGSKHNFGLYVVHQAIPGEELKHYKTVQACAGPCRCKYDYAGKKDKKPNPDEVISPPNTAAAIAAAFRAIDVKKDIHTRVAVPSAHKFNEAILNVYSHELDEPIPWHTDKTSLYSDDEMDGP